VPVVVVVVRLPVGDDSEIFIDVVEGRDCCRLT